jgi:hypothetical protein
MNNGRHNIPFTLNFSVILDQKSGEITLREGGLLSLKIPKHWQKTDTDTKNPALWVCHLPENSWGISTVSFYPTELEIKKKIPNQSNLSIYRGNLEITSENENQFFYRCQLKLLEEKKPSSGGSSGTIFIFLLAFIAIIIVVVGLAGVFKT